MGIRLGMREEEDGKRKRRGQRNGRGMWEKQHP